MNKQMRDVLIAAYLDYFNDYLTVERYAENNGLSEDQANRFLALAK